MAINPLSLVIAAAMTGINMLMSATRTIEGPRLNDTSASVADYGTPLNYFVGTRVLSCPSFFCKPILEVKKKRKGKGGKRVEYSGFGTWASHIADHSITRVLKIWFDNHLVFDATGSEEKTYPLGSGYDLEANMRIYLGGETQMPDPDMLAYIEARDGPDTCPAYRPTSYIYFESVPLEMLGNRFPNVSVLVENAPEIDDGCPDTASLPIVLDFKNGEYTVDGEPWELGCIFTPERVPIVEEGVGWVINSSIDLEGDEHFVFREAIGQALNEGFSVVFTFIINSHTGDVLTDNVELRLVSRWFNGEDYLFNYENYITTSSGDGTTIVWCATYEDGEPNVDSGLQPVTPDISTKAAFNVTPDEQAVSGEGAVADVINGDWNFTPDFEFFFAAFVDESANQITVEKVEFINAVSPAALPGLSS